MVKEDTVLYLNYKEADAIAMSAFEAGCQCDTVEGCLVDSYLIDCRGTSFMIDDCTYSKYIIITENYVNCWSTDCKVTLTDDDKLYSHWYEVFEAEADNE